MSSFFGQLRERKLVQWALAYCAGAFVAFQAIEVLAEPWGISHPLQRGVHVLLVTGLFLTLVLAWYHGEKGRQRVSGPELLMVAALLIIAGAVLTQVGPNRRTDMVGPIPTIQPDDDRPRLAILPCTNESPDPQDAFRASGLHDEILLKLQSISSLASLGRASVLQFAQNHPSIPEIASSLRVDFVGECTVQKDGDRLRVIFNLLDAEGVRRWAKDYDRRLTIRELFDIQIDIAEQVASSIGAVLTAEEESRIESRPTENLFAYELYQRARTRWVSRSVPAMHEAINFYQAAIAEDSLFALAYAGLGETFLILPVFDQLLMSTRLEWGDRAKLAAERALAIDPSLSNAYAVLGYAAYLYDRDWEEAERQLSLATTLDPGNSQARAWLAEVLITMQRLEEAVAEATRAARADPLSLNENWALAMAFWNAGRLSEAEDQIRHVWTLEQGGLAGSALEAILEQQGRFDEAEEVDLINARIFFTGEALDSALVVIRAERDPSLRRRAVAILQAQEALVPGFLPVSWYAEIGAMDEAVDAARRMVLGGGRVESFNWVQYRLLHSDPRFAEILDELGLPHPR